MNFVIQSGGSQGSSRRHQPLGVYRLRFHPLIAELLVKWGLSRPGTERAAHDHQLAEMVRRMIGDEKELTQVGLTLTGWNRREKIYPGVQRQLLQCLAVLLDRGHTLVPRFGRRWRRALGPVIGRPVELFVRGIATELQNVMLGQPNVFQQLPGRVGEATRHFSPKVRPKSGDSLLEADVSVLPIQEARESGADLLSRGYDGTPPVEPVGRRARSE